MPVVPSAAVGPFATVEDLATYLQRELSAADSATAELLLDLASAEIRSYTGQTISAATSTVTLNPPNGWHLFLRQLPVTAVTSVTVDGTLYVPTTDYVWYGDTGIIEFVRRWYWGTVRQSVVVQYDHGYAAGSPELGVAQAVCLEAAAAGFSSASSVGVRSEQVGTDSITYDTVRTTVRNLAAEGRLDSLRPLVIA